MRKVESLKDGRSNRLSYDPGNESCSAFMTPVVCHACATSLQRSVGEVGVEPTVSSAPCSRSTVPLHPDPRRSSPCGNRTRPRRLERPSASPEAERAKKVGQEALES